MRIIIGEPLTIEGEEWVVRRAEVESEDGIRRNLILELSAIDPPAHTGLPRRPPLEIVT
jgi:hypothetical protein